MDYGHWKGLKFDPAEYFGFVYTIRNKTNNRVYIGQKMLHRTIKRPPLKGKKNKRHSKADSDWRSYTGSSNELNSDIEKLGIDNFEFNIIELCKTRWELSYTEYKKIITEDAIPNRNYYNGFLGKVGRPSEKEKDRYTK